MTPAIETERRNRIRLSVAAYAYEFLDAPILTDAEFDALAQQINPEIATGHAVLDAFFRDQFAAWTGCWIHSHPDLKGLAAAHARWTAQRADQCVSNPYTLPESTPHHPANAAEPPKAAPRPGRQAPQSTQPQQMALF